MASSYSTNLAIELPALGEQGGGVWGTTTNRNLGTLIEQAISGYVTQAITDGADTVITIPNGATGVARNMYIECTGTLTANRNLVCPANRKLYMIFNNTTGSFSITVKVSGQTGITVPNGKKMILVCNGTDIVAAQNYFASFSAGGIDATPIGATTPATGAFTVLSATTSTTTAALTVSGNSTFTGTVSGAGITSLFASPPAIGTTTPNLATFTGVSVTGATIPNNGVYLSAANRLTFSTASTLAGYFDATQNLILAHPLAVLQGGTGSTTNAGTAYALKANNCSDMTAASVRTNIGLTTMDTNDTANTIVQRNGSADILCRTLNSSFPADNFTLSHVFYMQASDGYLRHMTMPNFRTQFASGTITGTTNGSIDLPGGITMQWGKTGTVVAGSGLTITFPSPFSGTAYSVVITANVAGGSAQSRDWISSVTSTNFFLSNSASAGNNGPYYWMAIGPT